MGVIGSDGELIQTMLANPKGGPFTIFKFERAVQNHRFHLKMTTVTASDDKHEDSMNPEGVRAVAEGDGSRHREHIGIHRHQEDSRKDGENLHGEVELARKRGIVGGPRLMAFVAFEDVPDADIGKPMRS